VQTSDVEQPPQLGADAPRRDPALALWPIVVWGIAAAAIVACGHYRLQLLIALSLFTALILIYELIHLATAAAVGMPAEEFAVYFGQSVVRWRVGRTLVRINWIPWGGYVKFPGLGDDSPEPAVEGILPAAGERRFTELHPLERALVAISAPLVVALMGAAALGFSESFRMLARLPQVVLQRGGHLNEGFLANAVRHLLLGTTDGHAFHVAAVMALTLGVMNLLPAPTVCGGMAVDALLRWLAPGWAARTWNRLALPWLLLMLLFFVYVGAIVFAVIFKG
jgi:membrane-associated protease RseP (regulator of RpoE activity)